MKPYTYSEARQNLATLLEEARRKAGVRIRRRDGESFLRPERPVRSPFDVQGADVDLGREQIPRNPRESKEVSWRGEGRSIGDTYELPRKSIGY